MVRFVLGREGVHFALMSKCPVNIFYSVARQSLFFEVTRFTSLSKSAEEGVAGFSNALQPWPPHCLAYECVCQIL